MGKKRKKKRTPYWLWLLPLIPLLLLAAYCAVYVREQAALSRIPPQDQADLAFLQLSEGQAETELGRALNRAIRSSWRWSCGEAVYSGDSTNRSAERTLTLSWLNPDRLTEGLADEVQEQLTAQALAARRSDEVFGEDGAFFPQLTLTAFEQALTARLEQAARFVETQELRICSDWTQNGWRIREDAASRSLRTLREEQNLDADGEVARLYEAVTAALEPVHKEYAPLEEAALAGPVPDAAFFGETKDPAEVAALLRSDPARQLIGDQTLVWNPELSLFPGSSIRYYLDDTILALVWQEVEAEAVGTFSEVLIADGSQLRRRISGDELFSFAFETTSEFCRKTNAVLAVGGDFYHHARACGICVYQRQICRFDPDTCDTCYITSDGDLLFSYRWQFTTQAQAEQFIAENDVLFSVAFGPVLIDNGVDVTPNAYPWGEIDDTYARSALGLLGEHHYLTMNINCDRPGTAYYNLATLRQAADAMLARGCIKAYTLDGGQTATTAFHGELINPVQFGWEKPISDVIYFATAVPDTD